MTLESGYNLGLGGNKPDLPETGHSTAGDSLLGDVIPHNSSHFALSAPVAPATFARQKKRPKRNVRCGAVML